MKLSIIIVNWNAGPLLRKCLDAVPAACAGLAYEVFVVDNASTDTSIAHAQQSGQPFSLIALPQNVGFARANNLALKSARGDVLLLLNPDTEPLPGSLATLVDFYATHQGAGVVGGKLLNADGSVQPSVRQFPTTLVLCLLLTRLARLFPNLSVLKKYFMKGYSYEQETSVDQVMGACFAISRRAFQVLGPLDEGFWIWFEEVDYCLRARRAGYAVWFTPRAAVVHHGAAAFRQVSPLWRAWRFARSALHYAYKNLGPVAAGLVLVCVPASLFTALFAGRKASADQP